MHSNKQLNTTPEDNQQNSHKLLRKYRTLSSPPQPRHKENNKI